MTEHARPLVTRPSPPAPPLGPALPSRVLPLEGTVPVTLDTRAAAPRLRPRLTRPAHAIVPGDAARRAGSAAAQKATASEASEHLNLGQKLFYCITYNSGFLTRNVVAGPM